MSKLTYRSWFYTSLPVMVWFLLLILPLSSFPANLPAGIRQHFLINIITSNVLLLIMFYVHTYLLYPVLKKRRWAMYLFTLAALLACYWLYWWLSRSMFPRPPVDMALKGFNNLNTPPVGGPMQRQPFGPPPGGPGIFLPILPPFIALLCSYCYRIILDNNARLQLIKERETIHLRTELNFLRSQINPHFLFNVLNNLTSLARKRSDQVEPAIINLSQLMRYMLYESDGDTVSLHKEVAYLKSYIELQLLRFGTEVTVKTDLEGDHSNLSIGPMLLISLVENAFKHGTDTIGHTTIFITLKVQPGTKKVHFKVVNDVLPGARDPDNGAAGIGLKNMKRRLDLLYPGKHRLTINNTGLLFSAGLDIDLV